MTVLNSVTDAVVWLVVIVIIIGVVLGFALSSTEVLNPITSDAKQREMDEGTRHQSQINTLQEQKLAEEVRHQAQLNSLKEQKQAEEYRMEIEYRKRKSDLGLVFWQIREQVLTAASAFALLIVAVGVAVLLARLGHRWSDKDQSALHPTSDRREYAWKLRAYNDARIQMARAAERDYREALAKTRETQDQAASSNNGHNQTLTLFDLVNRGSDLAVE